MNGCSFIHFHSIEQREANTIRMDFVDIEAEVDKNLKKTENSSRFERFLIRKYKCFIILIMSILSISEMIYLVLLKNGEIVEQGPSMQLIKHSTNGYTKALLAHT